jgi:hypothetical protein
MIGVAAALLLLAGCQKSDTKILIGATALPGAGAPPIEDSVIVVSGKTISAVGLRKDVPIPQDSERVSLVGKWVVPGDSGHLAPGEPANLKVLNTAPNSSYSPAPTRELRDGQWLP